MPFSTRSSEYALAKEAYERKLARQEGVLSKIKPATLLERLKSAADEVNEEGEELHASFMSGDISVESFMQHYAKLRQLYHERDLKCQAAEQIC